MTKHYISITGIVDDEGLPMKDVKKDLRTKAENLKLDNLQVYCWGQVKK